jgi:hypothetical protein
MLAKEALDSSNKSRLQKMSLDSRQCKMCGESPSTMEENFEDGLCPHCLNMVETD